MPGVIRAAVPVGTLPFSLCAKFSESRTVQMNMNEYHDGSCQRVSLVTGSRRTWKLPKRLDAFHLGLLRAFCNTVQGGAFQFYNPFETLPAFTKNPIGTAGLYLVRFNSDWSQINGMGRSDCDLEIIEVSATGAIDIGAPIIPGSGPGSGGGTNPPPPVGTGALYMSDGIVYTGTGQNGTFTFLTDAAYAPPWLISLNPGIAVATGKPPAAGWIGVVAVEITGDIDPNPALDIDWGISVTITPNGGGDTQTLSLGTYNQTIHIEGGLDSEVRPKSLYPPIYTSTPPVFQYNVLDGTTNSAILSTSFGVSLFEVSTGDVVYVGWPREHMDPRYAPDQQAFLYSFRDGVFLAGGRTIPSVWEESPSNPLNELYYTPPYLDYVGGPITPALNTIYDWPYASFDIVATQPKTFSVITLRLIGLDSYFPTTDIQTPSVVSLDGRGVWMNVRVGGSTYIAKLFESAVTVALNAPVSVTTGQTAVSLECIGADPRWFNDMMPSGILVPPYPLISVVLS